MGWKPRPHKTVYLVSAIMGLTLLGDSLLYSVLPLNAEVLGIPLLAVGVILSVNRWVRMVTNFLAAKSFARWGLHKPLVAAIVATVLVTFIYAQPKGIGVFLLARMMWGLCWSHIRLGSYLVILGTSGTALGISMGIRQAIARVGSAFAVLVGGFLVDWFGYRVGVTSMALLSSMAIPVAYRLHSELEDRNILDHAVQETHDNPCNLRPRSSLMFYNLAGFVTSFVGVGLVVSSVSLLLQQRIGDCMTVFGVEVGIATISGVLLAIRWISTFVMSPLAGRFSDVWGRRKTFLCLSIAELVALLALVFTNGPIATIAFAVMLFAVGTSLEVVLEAAIGDGALEGDAARHMSTYSSFYDLGAACGPLLGYMIGAQYGLSLSYLVGAMLILVVTVMLYFSPRFTELELKGES